MLCTLSRCRCIAALEKTCNKRYPSWDFQSNEVALAVGHHFECKPDEGSDPEIIDEKLIKIAATAYFLYEYARGNYV